MTLYKGLHVYHKVYVVSHSSLQAEGGGGGAEVVLQPELETISSKEEFTQNFSCVTSSQTARGTVQISNGLQSKAFQTKVYTGCTHNSIQVVNTSNNWASVR